MISDWCPGCDKNVGMRDIGTNPPHPNERNDPWVFVEHIFIDDRDRKQRCSASGKNRYFAARSY
jgi:hypothetical protein